MKCVPTRPFVVAPQIAKPPAKSQNALVRVASRRADNARRAAPPDGAGAAGASSAGAPYAVTPVAKRVLGLPRNLTPVCVIPIGWAKGKYGPTTRPAIEEVVHIDRYGNQPARTTR